MPGQVAAIAVYTQYQHPVPAAVVSALEREAGNIVSPIGLQLQWRSLDAVHGNEVSQQLAVVKFNGKCETRGLAPAAFRGGGLGWTHISDGEILPFMDLDCDRIRGFIRTRLAAMDPEERDVVLGRAMARVFVHELYHILGHTVRHGSGLADHRAYTVHELTRDEFALDAADCRFVEASGPVAPPVQAAISARAPGSTRRGAAKFVEKKCSVCHGGHGEGNARGPALLVSGRPLEAAELATKLGMETRAMCRKADQLKISPPALGAADIYDLVKFLNSGLD